MTQSGHIRKVLVLAFCGLFLIGVETAKGSSAASVISTEIDPFSETKKFIKKTEPPPATNPVEAAARPEGFSAQLEKPDPPQKATGISERAPKIVPLKVPPPAVSANRPGLSARGYTGRYFHLERPKIGLGLSYEFEEEKTKADGSATTDTSHEFRERLPIEASGWAYHPALCTFTLGVVPEWSQTKRNVDPGPSASDHVFVPSYAADAFFLEPKPYTVHTFASRREIKLRSAFSQPTDTTIDKYGSDLRLKYKILPTFVKYTHTDLDQSGFYDSNGEREDFQLSSQHVTKNSTTALDSNYSDDDRTSGGDTARVKTFDNNLGNEYYFTGDQRKYLFSRLRYRWTDNDSQESQEYGLSENLYWRYTDKLWTNYLFSYDERDTDAFDTRTTAFRANLQHLLYENLTTSVATGFRLNDFTGGEENAYDGDLNFLYNRDIPWGVLTLRSGWNYRYTTREGNEAEITVTDEPHVLTTGVATLLDNPNVDLDSIFVTDVTGTIAYIENVDYTIAEVGSFVQISRTTVGAIANGETVLVDYNFESDPAFDDTVFNQAYGIQFFLWNALTLAYGYQHADQNIVSGPPPENKIDDTTNRAEIRFNLGWTDTRLTYEDRDRSSGTSTRTWLASQTFRIRPLRRVAFYVTGTYGETDFTDVGQDQKQYGGSSRLLWRPTGWCRFRAEGFYNKISGDVEDSIDTNFTAVLELSYRIWRGSAGYYYNRSGSSDAYRIRNALQFDIIRILW
ncbi:MAG: hypothetical protein PVG35_02535 [Desulfobacterales bacterium]|jgi:hypothetical protein